MMATHPVLIYPQLIVCSGHGMRVATPAVTSINSGREASLSNLQHHVIRMSSRQTLRQACSPLAPQKAPLKNVLLKTQ